MEFIHEFDPYALSSVVQFAIWIMGYKLKKRKAGDYDHVAKTR